MLHYDCNRYIFIGDIMILFEQDGLEVSTIEASDKEMVIKLFSENDFGCDFESGALRPTNSQFSKIIDDIISGKTDEENIFVLRKNGKVIGYESMFVEFSRLVIGHIAVNETERGNDYGKLLTNCAIMVAENEGRDVAVWSNHLDKYLKSMGFETNDKIHYLHKYQGIKTPGLPVLFVSPEEYKKRQDKKLEEETERFRKFLESDASKMIFDL